MILENMLDPHGYARLCIADYHLEYPIPHPKVKGYTRCELFYNAGIVEDLRTELEVEPGDFHPFPGLELRYNGHYEPEMSLWLIQGSIENLARIWAAFHATLVEGPSGGDDDSFDYWPAAVDMLITFAHDLVELDPSYKAALADDLRTLEHRTIANAGKNWEDWDPQWEAIHAFAGIDPATAPDS